MIDRLKHWSGLASGEALGSRRVMMYPPRYYAQQKGNNLPLQISQLSALIIYMVHQSNEVRNKVHLESLDVLARQREVSNYGVTKQGALRRFYGVLEYSTSILNQLITNKYNVRIGNCRS